MEDVRRKRLVRLGTVLAVFLATVTFSVPSLCKDAEGKDTGEAPAVKDEDRKPDDLWMYLLDKQGKDLRGAPWSSPPEPVASWNENILIDIAGKRPGGSDSTSQQGEGSP